MLLLTLVNLTDVIVLCTLPLFKKVEKENLTNTENESNFFNSKIVDTKIPSVSGLLQMS